MSKDTVRMSARQEIRNAAWLLATTISGGAGAMVVGTEDHPLRHIAPQAITYFQSAGNMLWSGALAAGAVLLAGKREQSKGLALSAAKFAGAAAIAGVVVGGAANALYETETGYNTVGKHLLKGGETQDPYDFVWGTAFTALAAAGMGGHMRYASLRDQQKPMQQSVVMDGPEVPPQVI